MENFITNLIEIKSFLDIPVSTTTFDAKINTFRPIVEEQILNHTNNSFTRKIFNFYCNISKGLEYDKISLIDYDKDDKNYYLYYLKANDIILFESPSNLLKKYKIKTVDYDLGTIELDDNSLNTDDEVTIKLCLIDYPTELKLITAQATKYFYDKTDYRNNINSISLESRSTSFNTKSNKSGLPNDIYQMLKKFERTEVL